MVNVKDGQLAEVDKEQRMHWKNHGQWYCLSLLLLHVEEQSWVAL